MQIEQQVGVNAKYVTHQQISKEKGSLTVAERNGLLARSLGHVFAAAYVHIPLLTLDSMFHNPSKETAAYLFSKYKDVPWKGDVLVRVGHTSIRGDIARSLASGKDMKHMPPGWVRTLALPFTTLQSIAAKFFRYDHYNAFTNTVHVFHADKAVGMGRLAQATWFDALDDGVSKAAVRFAQGIPGVTGYVEWKTFSEAMKRFSTDEERKAATKIYEPYWGSVLMQSLVGPIGSLTAATGMTLSTAATIGGLVGGHVMARYYPKQEQRFDWVFTGGLPDTQRAALSSRAVPQKVR